MIEILRLLKEKQARVMLMVDGKDFIVKIRKNGEQYRFMCKESQVSENLKEILRSM